MGAARGRGSDPHVSISGRRPAARSSIQRYSDTLVLNAVFDARRGCRAVTVTDVRFRSSPPRAGRGPAARSLLAPDSAALAATPAVPFKRTRSWISTASIPLGDGTW